MSGDEIQEETKTWKYGGHVTLYPGDTVECTDLHRGHLYVVFAYNAAQIANDIDLKIRALANEGPMTLTIPGTAQNAGATALAFVSGDDTQAVYVSLPSEAESPVDVCLGNSSMPSKLSGMVIKELPMNGHEHLIDNRIGYTVAPPSKWLELQLTSDVTQFMCVRLGGGTADVFLLNVTASPRHNQIITLGPTPSIEPSTLAHGKYGTVAIHFARYDPFKTMLQGDRKAWVFMTATSSVQESGHSTIMLRPIQDVNS